MPDIFDTLTNAYPDCISYQNSRARRRARAQAQQSTDTQAEPAYVECVHCAQTILADEAIRIPGRSYRTCQGCADRQHPLCDRCETNRCTATYAQLVDNARTRWCQRCITYYAARCTVCLVAATTPTYFDDGGRCRTCARMAEYINEDEDEDEDEELINSYGYRPRPQFHGDGRVYLGMELEINTSGSFKSTRSLAYVAHNALGGLGYLKDDSSVSGFELVTHPMTHAYAAESFPWPLLEELAETGCRGDDGLHVHVNRDAFDGPSHIFRWLRFIYRNSQAITLLSRRHRDDLNEWASFTSYSSEPEFSKEHAKGSRDGARYSAVNVQNAATFEVRVFRASLQRQSVMAALDLVAGSVEYTRSLTVPSILKGGWTWDGFIKWAAELPEYAAIVAESKELV